MFPTAYAVMLIFIALHCNIISTNWLIVVKSKKKSIFYPDILITLTRLLRILEFIDVC